MNSDTLITLVLACACMLSCVAIVGFFVSVAVVGIGIQGWWGKLRESSTGP